MRKMFNILNIGAVAPSVAYLRHAMMTLRLATCHFHGRLHSFMPVVWALACLMATTVALSGCSGDETVSEAAGTPQVIAFSQYASPLQRAAELDNDYMTGLLRTYGFAVYGTKTAYSMTEQSLFTNTHVQWDATSNVWFYSPMRYWDKTSQYKFSAIAPYEETSHYSQIVESGTNTWRWQVSGIGYAKEGATPTNDYVIQRTPIEANGNDHTNSMNPPVKFDLHHIMAKVSFKIKKSDEMKNVTVTVKSLTMTGWKSGKNGTGFKQKPSDPTNGTSPDCSEWTITNNGMAGTYDIGAVTLIDADETEAGDKDLVLATEATTLKDAYIMVPQEIAANNLKFKLTYHLKYTDGVEEDYTDYEGVLTTKQTWGTDTHTTYTLTIGPKPIKFDVEINNFDGTDKSYDIIVE